MILLIDNYDSFSYNLYQLIGSLDADIKVVRNDVLTPEDILAMNPSSLIISPGPGRPEDAGICVEAVQKLAGKIPILGVCFFKSEYWPLEVRRKRPPGGRRRSNTLR